MSNMEGDKARGQTIWVGAVAYDPKVVTIWEGMRRYFHDEAQLAIEIEYTTAVSPGDLVA